jgi:hypothetical protein
MHITELRICFTDISDALALGENSIVENIFKTAKEIIKQGGSIIIEQRYENAQSDILAKYSTEIEVDNWKNKLNDIQVRLKRQKID